MNKKFYAGMISFGVAASFWACGSGEIIKPEFNDKLASEYGNTDSTAQLVNIDVLLSVCPECGQAVATSSSSSARRPITARSSSSRIVNPNNSSSSTRIVITSSSSSADPIINYSSSSSQNTGPVPVYSSSSSATIIQGGKAGTCGPEKPTVERGDDVVWVFDNDSKVFPGSLMLKSTFIWTTSDGTPATATIEAYNGKTTKTKYTTSGKHSASLHIDVTGGASYDLNCTPVQVNGAAITGCKCKAADLKPDITVGGSWTVTGCTSVGANITGYEWVGPTPSADGTSATQEFTVKNQMAAPIVNVSNDDNTVVAVQCDTVVSTDATAPDYLFEIENKLPQDAIEVKNKGCMSIRGKWSNPGYHPTVSVLCSMQGATTDVSFTMTYGTKTYKEMSYQSWGFSNVGGAIGQLNDGDVAFDNICVEFTGAETVECKLQ